MREGEPYIVIERDRDGGFGSFILGALVGPAWPCCSLHRAERRRRRRSKNRRAGSGPRRRSGYGRRRRS